ncbi:NTPase KAP family P-loop domain-containing protein 1 isoform X1 [Salmo trutta]|uniref:NTPase KAP family P-loop domain-containing protein 1-like n=2 Tax=Salmo trutta TaxID=8032 RepID=A0A673VX28_SALTR|nr:NTPase KAP family P-loop domain-containing protein 1-like isoform X1 [Salmo trutta]
MNVITCFIPSELTKYWNHRQMDGQGALLDDVYAYGLSRALIKVAPPATVGLFSQCPSRTETLLKKIKIYMNREAEWREQKHKLKRPPPAWISYLALLLSIIFFRPVWREKEERRRRRVRWIFVRFSAWHFAGSDKLWAGLVIRLFKAIQADFGELPLGLYRATQHPYPKKVTSEGDEVNWKAIKLLCLPLWVVVLAAVLFSIGTCTLLYLYGFELQTNGTRSWVTVLESMAIATLGPPAVFALRTILRTSKHLLYTMGSSIQHQMNSSAVSDQMGFMNKVRKEVGVMVDFIHFMEVFEGRRIRVVLEITHLDRCSPDRVVRTLEAMNVLLAGENVPFVSILAVDPRVVVGCVESTMWFCGLTSSGYDFLNKMVTLPFSVPEMSPDSKCRAFKTLADSYLEPDWECIKRGKQRAGNFSAFEKCRLDDSLVPFIGKGKSETELLENGIHWEIWAKKIKALTNEALHAIYTKYSPLHVYLMGNHVHMRRIINSVRVTVIVMDAMNYGGFSKAKDLAAWVVMANLWPCRLSWILQCSEDSQQRADTDDADGAINQAKTLWEVFSETSLELHMLRDRLETVLEQDGDPELFERFLKVDFQFTLKDVDLFRLCTVNLDQSIKEKLAWVRGGHSLRDRTKSNAICPLRIGTVISTSTEDICKEMDKLNIPVKYQQLLTEKQLDGASLVYGRSSEIRHALQMTLGEWIAFSSHFLEAKPDAQPHAT